MMIVNDNEKLGRKMFLLSSEFLLLSMQNKIIIYQKLIYAKHKKELRVEWEGIYDDAFC